MSAGDSRADPGIALPSPDMIPAVTVFWNPSGLPPAIASSPTLGKVSAKAAAGNDVRAARSTARSVRASVTINCALARCPSAKATSN